MANYRSQSPAHGGVLLLVAIILYTLAVVSCLVGTLGPLRLLGPMGVMFWIFLPAAIVSHYVAHGRMRAARAHTYSFSQPAPSYGGGVSAGETDDLVNRLRSANVLTQTSASLAPMSWSRAKRSDLVDGVLASVEDAGGRAVVFIPAGGPPFVIPPPSISSVLVHASGLNTIVDMQYVDQFGRYFVVCLVAPRDRLAKLLFEVGHPI